MSISFVTNQPKALLASFKKKIDEGHVVTWAYDKDGDFSHTPQQWKGKAWLRPKVSEGKLIFNTIKPNNINISQVAYAIYHGRFIESMLEHCDSLFTESIASAVATVNDRI